MSKNEDWYHYMGWKNLGIDVEDAIKWKSLNSDPDIISGWLSRGFTPEEAEPFMTCETYEFSPNEARNWLDQDIEFEVILYNAISGNSFFNYVYDPNEDVDPCANGCGECRDCEID